MVKIIVLIIFVLSIFSILLHFILYPVFLFFLANIFPKHHKVYNKIPEPLPFISIILAFYGDIKLLKDKIKNFMTLIYPKEKLELIICFDGPLVNIPEIEDAKEKGYQIKVLSLNKRMGKIFALNKAQRSAKGDFLLFTDADAIFESDAIIFLLRHFKDPEIGGVFGYRYIKKKHESVGKAQSFYVNFETMIKEYESKIGSTTSNDGKIYMIKREYFEDIAPKTTDDLYCALRVIAKGKRFIFEKKAIAYIKKPSKNLRHELIRRKRIVAQSMNSLWLNRELFNPLKYGLFSVGLFITKVLRRIMLLFLLGIFISSVLLYYYNPIFKLLLYTQIGFYLFAGLHPLFSFFAKRWGDLKKIETLSMTLLYFLAGSFGSLLGIFAFLKGDIPSIWESIKE